MLTVTRRRHAVPYPFDEDTGDSNEDKHENQVFTCSVNVTSVYHGLQSNIGERAVVLYRLMQYHNVQVHCDKHDSGRSSW